MLPRMSNRAPELPPLIAITVADPAGSDDPALAARKNQLYAAGIARHGGNPALLHAGTPAPERDRLLGAMDGLLMAGGADIDPALYGETVSGAVMCPGTQTTISPLPTPTPDEPSASSSPAFA